MASVALNAKQKGNAAFKAGDYPTAIGEYSRAIVADNTNPVYPLNRAAAYIKLGKHDDAERDCSTVLILSPSNVKALFRRGQARVQLEKLSEAENDLKEALRLEPNNDSIQSELNRLDDLVRKKESNRPSKAPSTSVDPSTTGVPSKRRRVPITIVELSTSSSPLADKTAVPVTQLSAPKSIDLLTPLSSRPIKQSLYPQIPTSAAAPTFQQAKEVRESTTIQRKPGGGGIFRSSGSHTIFPAKENTVPSHSPSAADRSQQPTAAAASLRTTALDVEKAPMTLFEFTRYWEFFETPEERWKLLSQLPPSSLPTLFKSSLEPALLSSLLQTFLAVLQCSSSRAKNEQIRAYMLHMAKTPRFATVLLFMSADEKKLARDVWGALGERKDEGWDLVDR